MLEVDYPTRYGELIQSLDWEIELPREWSGYFQERGEGVAFANDERGNQRLKVRTHGLLWIEKTLPFLNRARKWYGVYTRDFSRHGCGFLAPFEFFPEEQVRIVLPTLWLQLHVARTRRITSKCYEVGCRLIKRYDAAPQAFPD